MNVLLEERSHCILSTNPRTRAHASFHPVRQINNHITQGSISFLQGLVKDPRAIPCARFHQSSSRLCGPLPTCFLTS